MSWGQDRVAQIYGSFGALDHGHRVKPGLMKWRETR